MLFEKIKKGNYDADDPIWESISAEAKDCVAKLLTVDPDARMTAEEALTHPWVFKMCGASNLDGERRAGGRRCPACTPACLLEEKPQTANRASLAKQMRSVLPGHMSCWRHCVWAP